MDVALPRNPYIKKIREHEDLICIKHNKPNFEWGKSFPQDFPLVIDLGCGSGNFLVGLAGKKPDLNFMGVEIKYKRLCRAAEKTKKLNLTNLRFLQIYAEELSNWFPEKSIFQIFINFPDPWPKKRHHKNRLFHESLLENLHRLLEDDGRLIFKTDHREYFDSSLEIAKTSEKWDIQKLSFDLHNSDLMEPFAYSEFEVRFVAQQKPICLMELRKII